MKTFANATDVQLIKLFREGNPSSLEILIDRHKKKIFSTIVLLVKDKHLAEDMFQDVFIKIIDFIRTDRYNEEGKFLPWAVRIAHNACVDYFRKGKNTLSIASDSKEAFESIGSVGDDADLKINLLQSHSKLRTLINKLPEEQREVLVLRHFAELSFKEIADATNVSINTSLGRMRYALINLRKMIVENQIIL
jgi:RNA polymerase sigma factor (sigma-70 family)